MHANSNNSLQTNISSLCRYSLMINQISNDIHIHLIMNGQELKARHVSRRSTTQCNTWTSRFRYTVLFSIHVQDSIKYLPFGMSGTVAESVTDATLLFTKTRKKLCQHITEISAQYGVPVNGAIISSTLTTKEYLFWSEKKYITPSSKDQFQH